MVVFLSVIYLIIPKFILHRRRFNKDWKKEYGGSFIDIENKKTILPIFNRAVFFHVPYKHRVEEIIVDV